MVSRVTVELPLGLLVLASLLGVAGCSAGSGLLADPDRPAALRLVTLDTAPIIATSAASATGPGTIQIRPATFTETEDSGSSAWCQYLKEDSAAEATILRSPSVNGTVNTNGQAGVSLGLSVSSFTKARLLEEAAQVKCRRHVAETGMQKLAFVPPRGLTPGGYRAKSFSIQVRKGELDELRQQIKYELRRGNISAEKADYLSGLIDQVHADGNAAKSLAARPPGEKSGTPEKAAFLGEDLRLADAELDEINRRIRDAEAMDVSVSAGWTSDGLRDGYDVHDGAFIGQVSFSYKLGALSPQRFAHEARAREAKLSAMQEQEKGAPWQAQLQLMAEQRSLAGLLESQIKLNRTLAETLKLVTVMSSVPSREFAGTLIAARIQVVGLLAEKAAIDGSIEEIDRAAKPRKTG